MKGPEITEPQKVEIMRDPHQALKRELVGRQILFDEPNSALDVFLHVTLTQKGEPTEV